MTLGAYLKDRDTKWLPGRWLVTFTSIVNLGFAYCSLSVLLPLLTNSIFMWNLPGMLAWISRNKRTGINTWGRFPQEIRVYLRCSLTYVLVLSNFIVLLYRKHFEPNTMYLTVLLMLFGLPWWLSDKESFCQCKNLRFNCWVRKIPWRRIWQLTPVFLPGKSHEQKRLGNPTDRRALGYSPRGCKESDMT